MIPNCSFSVIQLGEEKNIPVQYRVKLIGARFPNNVLTLDIRPPTYAKGKHSFSIIQYAYKIIVIDRLIILLWHQEHNIMNHQRR